MASLSKELPVERIPSDSLSDERFFERYLRPEVPVIVSGVSAGRHDEITPDYFKRTFMHASRRHMGWFDAAITEDDGPIRMPPLVKHTLERADVSLRSFPMRVWLQPKGHHTLPHYDGNSLHGLNLQVHGRKHWLLVPPTAPLPSISFGFASSVPGDFDVRRSTHPYAEFVTEPGDLLFLPRYWIHEVRSLDDVNMNINWVFTPTAPNRTSALGTRECELLKARTMLPWLKALFPITVETYGGQGQTLVDRYTNGVTAGAAVKRLLLEFGQLPRTLRLKKVVAARVRELSHNNFNVNS
jgi:hypothetical protein